MVPNRTRHPWVAAVLGCLLAVPAQAQRVIPLPTTAEPPGSGDAAAARPEREVVAPDGTTRLVYDVSQPTLTAYLPAPRRATGAAAVVCPGGAFHVLAMDVEGHDVARWLAARGVAAFVLKYRLAPSRTADPMREVAEAIRADQRAFDAANAPYVRQGVADGRAAVRYVRAHAAEFGVAPARVGIIGFSAGGTVATSVALQDSAASRPAFLASIYPYLNAVEETRVPAAAPPLFVAAATDDGLSPQGVRLYGMWTAAGKSAELHVYSQGGHGFGMRTQRLPVDHWLDPFERWLALQGVMTPAGPAPTR